MEEQIIVNEQEQEEQEGAKTTFTLEEVQKIVQSESDRRTNQALSKQKKEYEKKLSLSGLDEAQRKQAEKDMMIQELQAQVSGFKELQNKAEVMKTLSGRGLPPAFADLIHIGDDIEDAQQRIDQLDKLFKDAVQAEVKKRLNSNTPKTGAVSGELTPESFKKLSLVQQNQIAQNQPELFKKLAGI